MGKRPNILWICSDQQRADSLGCYGNPHVRTPNIDRLAKEGARFNLAFCQNPVCTPSRSSFLTGRYPRTTCCRQNGQSIPEREILISRLLHETGYACGLAGKLHLSACNPGICHATERRISDGYDIFSWSHDANDYWPTNEYYHWLKEEGVPYRQSEVKESAYAEYGMPEEYHQTTWCVNQAVRFIETCGERDEPWMFSLNIFDPHPPYNPPEAYLKPYLERLEEIPLPNYIEGELEDKPACHMEERLNAWNSRSINRSYISAEMSDTDRRCITAAYYAMVDLIDTQVGRLLKILERMKLLEDTIVIYMSDHGELLGDHSMYYKGPFLYDCSVRVPLILSWKGHIRPMVSNALTELVDLPETLLELCGLEIPRYMQGKSLCRVLDGSGACDSHRENVYCEFYNSLPWNHPAEYATMLRTKTHKLVVYHTGELGELYDLEKDPGENRNLWNSPDHQKVRGELMKQLCDRMAFTVDPLPFRDAAW